jgi:hypothetical protein
MYSLDILLEFSPDTKYPGLYMEFLSFYQAEDGIVP